MTFKVLISDPMSSQALAVFEARGITATQTGKMSAEELEGMIADYDGLAIRSTSQVTPALLQKAAKLKVVGRAGIGVDNIDVPACTERGVVVMNTPFGNAITTAEHALSMMLSLARHIPQATASTRASKWEKSAFMGIELTGKTLGIIGSGNIGSIVAQKAIGFGLKVIAYDPYLSEERALKLGVAKVELDELLQRADVVSLHVPRTPQTANIIDASALNKMKKGAMLVNCARGGLVDEAALYVALKSGHLRGAALDVFEKEPAKDNPLFELQNFICTPHLGASTTEAQEKVALQIAEQMSNYLLEGAIVNSLNTPNLSAQEAQQLGPYLQLADCLGTFAGQLSKSVISGIKVSYAGDITELNLDALTTRAVQSVLQPHCDGVNSINAREVAKARGIHIVVSKDEQEDDYPCRMSVELELADKNRNVSGTLMQKRPRLIDIKGIKLESEFGEHMLYITNQDHPGVIGGIGMVAAQNNINIANMHLGRRGNRGDAISLIKTDSAPTAEGLQALRDVADIQEVHVLHFPQLAVPAGS